MEQARERKQQVSVMSIKIDTAWDASQVRKYSSTDDGITPVIAEIKNRARDISCLSCFDSHEFVTLLASVNDIDDVITAAANVLTYFGRSLLHAPCVKVGIASRRGGH